MMMSSVQKRKREDAMLERSNIDALCRTLSVTPLFNGESTDWFSLYYNGHVLRLSPDSSKLNIYPHLLKRPDEGEEKFEESAGIEIGVSDVNCSNFRSALCDVGIGPNNSIDMVLCSPIGELLLANASSDAGDQHSAQTHIVQIFWIPGRLH